MLLDEIGTRLASTGVNAAQPPGSTSTSPWTLFKSLMPPGPNKAVVITETGGFAPFAGFGLNQPTFQVRVRGEPINESTAAYSDARTKIEAVKSALHALPNGAISGYAGIWAEQDPFPLGYDENQRPELSLNFRALRDST